MPATRIFFNLNYWINPERGELFFARKVVLAEGSTEKTILPLLAEKLGIFRHDFTLIDCGSKDSMPSYLQLLNKFRIPYVAVYDRDHQMGKFADAIAVLIRHRHGSNNTSMLRLERPSLWRTILRRNSVLLNRSRRTSHTLP